MSDESPQQPPSGAEPQPEPKPLPFDPLLGDYIERGDGGSSDTQFPKVEKVIRPDPPVPSKE